MTDVELQDAASSPASTPDGSQSEAAWLLAAEAKPRLNVQGFGDEQIEEWAADYVREAGGGDTQGFVAWLAERQRG